MSLHMWQTGWLLTVAVSGIMPAEISLGKATPWEMQMKDNNNECMCVYVFLNPSFYGRCSRPKATILKLVTPNGAHLCPLGL